MTILWLVTGLIVLSVGAELLVRSASALAVAARVSPLVIGLTVVSYGTGAPEFVVSVQSAVRGHPEIALGNVIGSNIINVLLILGLSAAIVPLVVSRQLVRLDVPLMIAVSVATLLMSLDGSFTRVDGLLLVSALVIYTVWIVRASRREQTSLDQQALHELGVERLPTSARDIVVQILTLAVGLCMLIVGSRLFADAATDIARQLGISELVIGLTIVALGTSLPEVATSVLASVRGELDIAVGNVVGSNLFNLMGVMGFSGVMSTNGIPVPDQALQHDLPVMVAVAVACLPIFSTGHRIARWEGCVFLGYYCAYTTHLVLLATNPAMHWTFKTIMFWFVIPLTVLTLCVSVFRSFRERPPRAATRKSPSTTDEDQSAG